MSDNKLGDKVLGQIKDKEIKPKSRLVFLAKNYLVWGLAGLAVVSGGLAAAVMILHLRSNDWALYRYLGGDLATFILISAPYFWLLMLAALIIAAMYNLQHTKHGYRHRLPLIIGSTVVLSIILGAGFYRVGIGQAIDDALIRQVPHYPEFSNHPVRLWLKPEKGRLVGVIIATTSNAGFRLIDQRGDDWQVYISDRLAPPPPPPLDPGTKLKLIGKIEDSRVFQARRIMPFNFGPGLFERHEKVRRWMMKFQ